MMTLDSFFQPHPPVQPVSVFGRSEGVVAYLHIPKAGGTSLRRVAQRQYEPGSIVHLYPARARERFAALPEERRRQARFLTGHFSFGVHELVPLPTRYFSVVRDPLERILSDYSYIQQEPGHVHHQLMMSQEWTFEDFVFRSNLQCNNNGQLRSLAGMMDAPIGACSRETIETALSNIDRHFVLVGLTERFDEALLLLQRMLGWESVYVTRENVTRTRVRRSDLSESVIERIEEHNRLDLELYGILSQRFEQTVRSHGEAFGAEVEAFRALNTRLSDLERCGEELLSAGEVDGAQEQFERALSTHGLYAPAHKRLARLHWQAARADRAIEHVSVALEVDPYDRETVLLAGEILEARGRWDRARSLYSFYLEQENPFDDELFLRRNALDHLGSEPLTTLLATCGRLGC